MEPECVGRFERGKSQVEEEWGVMAQTRSGERKGQVGPGFGEPQVMCGAREHEAGMSLADTSDLSARTESGNEGREAMIGGDWAHGVDLSCQIGV